ncbi:hypothetical protein Pint_36154 [Pistacia integerrima]|uniref:Uncharacterized protein n=1 Tax=Pistacia integerrima TaxID=434235 RepID=A0ACC0Y2V3_9ROSI|nr:hypothetical protein Pint_36154 [Pistacia integerrima]
MAEFPPNLDDGERYLPSDIFINERPRHRLVDDVAHHFNALSFLQQTHHPPPPPEFQFQFERSKPPVRGTTLPHGHFGAVNGGLQFGQRLRPYDTGSFSKPALDLHILKSTPPQVECYKEPRTTRVLQKQQNRLLQQNQNRVVLRGGFGFNGGLVRESGGTGVFHPRIIKTTNTTTATATSTDAKKKVVRNRQDIQAMQQRNSMKRVGVSKREDCHYHLPADMGLPRDWTY